MQEVPIDAVAFVLTAISILVVYHLFAMELWMSAVGSAVQEVREVAARPRLSEFDRAESLALLKQTNWRFPAVQTTLLLCAVAGLTYINLAAAARVNVAKLFTVGPTLILDGVIFLATVGAVVSGTVRIRRARKLVR